MAKVKICGIRRECDIEYLNLLLPDFAGFVFAAGRRRVSREYAASLAERLDIRVKRVGVFVDEKPEEVIKTTAECRLDIIQLHGEEPQEYVCGLKKFLGPDIVVWKAIRVRNLESLSAMEEYPADAFVLDAFNENSYGGSGRVFDWQLAVKAKRYGDIILAGGLDPLNVRDAISLVRPFAVDVSSGVETNGFKDEDKVKGFIYGARSITY